MRGGVTHCDFRWTRRGTFARWMALGVACVCSLPVKARNAQSALEDIPPFRPPKPELPPTFWEDPFGPGHRAVWFWVAGAVVLMCVASAWILLLRRRPVLVPTPAETARAALAALDGPPPLPDALTTRLHDQVSGILRTYFVAVLELPVTELTGRELAAAMEACSKAGKEVAVEAGTLLRQLERKQFDPEANAADNDVVQKAMKLVDLMEARLRPVPAVTAAADPVS